MTENKPSLFEERVKTSLRERGWKNRDFFRDFLPFPQTESLFTGYFNSVSETDFIYKIWEE